MTITLKNSNHFAYMVTYYIGLSLFIYAATLAPNVEYVNIYSMILLNICLFLFIVGILVYLTKMPVTFTISNEGIALRTWKYFFIKDEKYKFIDVKRIEILKGVASAAKIKIYFKNGQSIKVGFELYNDIVGDLAEVKLSESAPIDSVSQLAIKVGMTISVRAKTPLSSVFIE